MRVLVYAKFTTSHEAIMRACVVRTTQDFPFRNDGFSSKMENLFNFIMMQRLTMTHGRGIGNL